MRLEFFSVGTSFSFTKTLIFVLLLITNDDQNTKGHKIKWLFQKFPVPLFGPYLILIVCDENHVAQDHVMSHKKQGWPIDLVTTWAILYLVNVKCMLIADGLDS